MTPTLNEYTEKDGYYIQTLLPEVGYVIYQIVSRIRSHKVASSQTLVTSVADVMSLSEKRILNPESPRVSSGSTGVAEVPRIEVQYAELPQNCSTPECLYREASGLA